MTMSHAVSVPGREPAAPRPRDLTENIVPKPPTPKLEVTVSRSEKSLVFREVNGTTVTQLLTMMSSQRLLAAFPNGVYNAER